MKTVLAIVFLAVVLFWQFPPLVCAQGNKVAMDWRTPDLRYRVVEHGQMTGFERPDFDDSKWLVDDAPFGIPNDICPDLKQDIKTAWRLGTDLLIRKTFQLPQGAKRLRIRVAIDDEVQIFLNGRDVSGGMQANPHPGCASRDVPFSVRVPDDALAAGKNVLAIRGRDNGGADYFDVTITYE